MNYTSKDYLSILTDLVNTVPDLTTKWTATDDTDVGVVLLKLEAVLGDLLSYNMDQQALQLFPNTVTQRKVAYDIFKNLGYHMHWYQAGVMTVTVSNTTGDDQNLKKYTTLRPADNNLISLVTLDTTSIVAYGSADISFYEGSYIKETDITKSDINEYRYKLESNNISETGITVTETVGLTSYTWTFVDDIDSEADDTRVYELDYDELDNVYIKFSDSLDTETSVSAVFTIEYIATTGADISINADYLVDSERFTPPKATSEDNSYKVISNTVLVDGENYETPEEAYEQSKLYVNTANTLVTPADFQNAIRRITDKLSDGSTVKNCHTTDLISEGEIFTPIYAPTSTPYDIDTYTITDVINRIVTNICSSVDDDELSDLLVDMKMLNLDMKNSDDIFYCNWKPIGTVVLSKKVNITDQETILSNIYTGLLADYTLGSVEFGEVISQNDLKEAIMSYDTRISDVNLDTLVYNITNPERDFSDVVVSKASVNVLAAGVDYITVTAKQVGTGGNDISVSITGTTPFDFNILFEGSIVKTFTNIATIANLVAVTDNVENEYVDITETGSATLAAFSEVSLTNGADATATKDLIAQIYLDYIKSYSATNTLGGRWQYFKGTGEIGGSVTESDLVKNINPDYLSALNSIISTDEKNLKYSAIQYDPSYLLSSNHPLNPISISRFEYYRNLSSVEISINGVYIENIPSNTSINVSNQTINLVFDGYIVTETGDDQLTLDEGLSTEIVINFPTGSVDSMTITPDVTADVTIKSGFSISHSGDYVDFKKYLVIDPSSLEV